MLYALLAVVSLTALWMGIRYYGLKRAIRNSDRELLEITKELEQNRIVKMSVPCRELEELLTTVNTALEDIRRQKVIYEDREAMLQKQIENISHDLRTPLTSIIGYLGLIDKHLLDEEDIQSLEIVRRKAGTLQRLITQFYDLSRMEAGDYKLNMQEKDIGRMLREMLLDSFGDLEQKGIRVEAWIPETPVLVNCDEAAVERIFLNLVQNAVRYAVSTLKVNIELEGKRTVIVFVNDVSGMKQGEAERLFDRFYSSDLARGQGSTGLGLTISRYFAESMGGKMEAELIKEGGGEWLRIRVEFYSFS